MNHSLVINCSNGIPVPGCAVEPGQFDSEPEASFVLRLSLFSLFIFASFVGNAAVVKAIRELPCVQKPLTYYLVTNMAVAELIGTVCLPFFQIYDELQTWVFGETMCRLVNALMLSSYFVVPWSLALIAVLRLRVLLARRVGAFALSWRRLSCLVAFLWICGFAICFPTFVYATQVKTIYDDFSYWCIELFPGDTLDNFPSPRLKRFYFIRFFLNFGIPGGVVMAAYGGVALKIKRHLTRARYRKDDSQTISMTGVGSGGSSEDTVVIVVTPPENEHKSSISQEKIRKHDIGNDMMEMEHDLLRMIYIVVVIYLVCYIPYQVFFLMEYFGYTSWMTWKHFTVTRKYVFLLTCFPSAIHPACYGTMCKFYAKIFSRVFLCKSHGANF